MNSILITSQSSRITVICDVCAVLYVVLCTYVYWQIFRLNDIIGSACKALVSDWLSDALTGWFFLLQLLPGIQGGIWQLKSLQEKTTTVKKKNQHTVWHYPTFLRYKTLPLYLCEFCSATSINELAAELDGLRGIRLQLLLDSHFLSGDTCKNRRNRRHKRHPQPSFIWMMPKGPCWN